MKSLLALVVVAASILSAHAAIHRKSLAGPPEEFALHAQPHPVDAATSSQATMIPVDYVDTLQEKFVWDSPIIVDSSSFFGFTVYSPVIVKVTLVDPNMKIVELDDLAIHEMTEILGTHVPTTTYYIQNPIPGMYWIHLESPESHVAKNRETRGVVVAPDAYVIVKNDSPLELISYANTFDLAVGTDIGLMAFLADTSSELTRTKPVMNMLALAKLAVTFPDGHKETVQMHDDGVGADLTADDGVFVGVVPSTEAGYYTVQASVSGFDENGREFTRTTDHLFAVSSVVSDLSGHATIQSVSSDSMMQIDVGMTAMTANSIRFYGELYGTSQNNELVPVCWIGGLNDVVSSASGPSIVMQVDLDWLTRAGVKPEGPFVLKNAFVQDVANWAIVSTASEIQLTYVSDAVKDSVGSLVNAAAPLASQEITERMRQGVRPEEFAVRQATAEDAVPLILLHGYCSPVNPWTGAQSDFTNPVFFLNANASIGHDDYSKIFLNWASKHNAYSAIGHSQGGIVLAHIKNYYWSGLDTHNKPTGRLIQSVASPYQGNSAAGSTANLGKMFGVGCGSNSDLTVSGSKLWLSGITAESRALVYVYTATYKQTVTVDYCNAAMNLVIKTYNDGVAELVYTPLPGAKEVGNREPWCHSDSMKYTQTTLDSVRNKEMNSAAQK